MNDTPSNVKILVRIRGNDPNSYSKINTFGSNSSIDRLSPVNNTGLSTMTLNRNKTSTYTARSSTLTRSKSPISKTYIY